MLIVKPETIPNKRETEIVSLVKGVKRPQQKLKAVVFLQGGMKKDN